MGTQTHIERAQEILWETGHARIAEAMALEVKAIEEERDRAVELKNRYEMVLYPGPYDAESIG